MFLQEVILENFMSYEYARIPFKAGVNVVVGPNGAGKSSILLGISVALGQSYTERSKKLSNLIRWGKDQARITLILDNTPSKGGKRPIPKIDKDQIFLTRVLRRDGKYWSELDNRAATRDDVKRLLSKLGVDPDNMLIIMHQNMVEEFTVLPPQEKLRIVEAAVGFESFRQNVIDAQRKLGKVLSEEESVGKLLESAESTLTYWREQYDRYQQKKQLIMKRRLLDRELAWAQISKKEKALTDLQEEIKSEQDEIKKIESQVKKVDAETAELQSKQNRIKESLRELLNERIKLEHEKAQQELNLLFSDQTLKETQSLLQTRQEQISSYIGKLEQFETTLNRSRNISNTSTDLANVRKSFEQIENTWMQQLNQKSETLKQQVETLNERLPQLITQVKNVEAQMDSVQLEMDKDIEGIVDHKIRSALLNNQKESLNKTVTKLSREQEQLTAEIRNEIKRAEETGPRLAPMKSIDEILDEMRLTDGHLAALADASENVEHMYESYSKLYLELKEKARLVAENREKALVEVKARMESWHKVLQELLNHVNVQYQTILVNAQAEGEVDLINEQDIETAGLQILVGFKGAKPLPLDAYTQSGGERSTATIAFLLALQQHVRSPFRAVDEYDVHMDPRNREVIAKLLIAAASGHDTQYVAITPSQITFKEQDAHIITVQNIQQASTVKELA